MFNIGGRGQILIAAAAPDGSAGRSSCPRGLHILLAPRPASRAARSGAESRSAEGPHRRARGDRHDHVNYVAFFLISFLLKTQGAAPGSRLEQPEVAAGERPSRRTLSDLLGAGSYRLHSGFVLVIPRPSGSGTC